MSEVAHDVEGFRLEYGFRCHIMWFSKFFGSSPRKQQRSDKQLNFRDHNMCLSKFFGPSQRKPKRSCKRTSWSHDVVQQVLQALSAESKEKLYNIELRDHIMWFSKFFGPSPWKQKRATRLTCSGPLTSCPSSG